MSDRSRKRADTRVDAKIVLSGLWTSMVLVFAYVDIFGFWRADVVKGALSGRVPQAGLDITQTFLMLTTAYVLVPTLMIAFCLMAPARISRPVNIVASVLYAGSVAAFSIGETWAYYLLGSAVEVALLLTIAGFAWFWPTTAGGLGGTGMAGAIPAAADDVEPGTPLHHGR